MSGLVVLYFGWLASAVEHELTQSTQYTRIDFLKKMAQVSPSDDIAIMPGDIIVGTWGPIAWWEGRRTLVGCLLP
jgi:hypothetical protein